MEMNIVYIRWARNVYLLIKMSSTYWTECGKVNTLCIWKRRKRMIFLTTRSETE